MATVTESPESSTASESRMVPTHRLTVDRYLQMVAAGIFKENEPIFLWNGRLAQKMTIGPDHSNTLILLDAMLSALVPTGWHVRQEQPIRFGEAGLPEPDLSVVRGKVRDYGGRMPTAQDVALVIEVADSSLAYDSGEVLETFAREAIPIYWIVNLPHRRVEVYREPTGPSDWPSYRERRFYGPNERVPVVLDGREVGLIEVSEILP